MLNPACMYEGNYNYQVWVSHQIKTLQFFFANFENQLNWKILQQLYVSNGVMKSVEFVGFQDFICQRDKKMSVLRTREPGLTPGTGSDKGASQDKKSRISQVRASLLSA